MCRLNKAKVPLENAVDKLRLELRFAREDREAEELERYQHKPRRDGDIALKAMNLEEIDRQMLAGAAEEVACGGRPLSLEEALWIREHWDPNAP